MFDDFEKPRPRRWQTAVIVVSAVVHAAAIGGVAVAAMWKIEKLDVSDNRDITFRVPAPQGASAPPPAARLAVQKAQVTPPKIKPPVPVQPTIVKDPVTLTTGTTTNATGTTTGPGGNGNDPDADPQNPGTCLNPPCVPGGDGDPEPEPVVKKDPEPEQTPIVPPNVGKGLRISGNEQIHPPEMVRVDMLHQGKSQLSATFQVCVGRDGHVDALRTLKSSGFADYDAKLLSEMRQWRYRPYLVNGKPSPMCTVSVFQYRMTR
jgi:TonB family protein